VTPRCAQRRFGRQLCPSLFHVRRHLRRFGLLPCPLGARKETSRSVSVPDVPDLAMRLWSFSRGLRLGCLCLRSNAGEQCVQILKGESLVEVGTLEANMLQRDRTPLVRGGIAPFASAKSVDVADGCIQLRIRRSVRGQLEMNPELVSKRSSQRTHSSDPDAYHARLTGGGSRRALGICLVITYIYQRGCGGTRWLR
jgi:hypothetical protein